jgi:fermentation-respiration switch protein FrsA (DUF1100 family)
MWVRFFAFLVLASVLGFAALVAYVRFELRPRPAALDPAATGLPVEAVTIQSKSGARLAGWFLRGSGNGAVLLLHGIFSNRLVQVERMRMLREAGYSALAIDFQAHGESAGDLISLGKRESLDARLALAWLRSRLPGERVAVLGISMGGAAALIGKPIDADALVIESAPSDLGLAISNRLALAFGPAGRSLTPVVLTALRIGAGLDAKRLRPVDGLASLRIPVFVMTGAKDKKTTVEESRAMFEKANPPKSYWEVPGAWHVDLAFAGGAAYRERLLAFLDASLRRGDRDNLQ